MSRPAIVMIVAVFALAACVRTSDAQWMPQGVRLCDAAGDQFSQACVSDSAGGAIALGYTGATFSIPFVVRMDPSGLMPAGWPMCGVPVCTTTGSVLTSPQGVSDGVGGVLVLWSHRRSGDSTYLQRIGADGAVAPGWPADPLPVVPNLQVITTRIVSDGAHGAYLVGSSGEPRVYAARFAGSGGLATGWPATGVKLTTLSTGGNPCACPDGEGGVYVAWADFRNAIDADIYCQRLGPDGAIAPGWPAGGLPLCTAPGDQAFRWSSYLAMVPDASGGTLVMWADYRSGATSGTHLYAQRVTASGGISFGWPVDGVPVLDSPRSSSAAVLASDGANGMYLAWSEARTVAGADVFAQHLLHDGAIAPGWPVDGLLVCGANEDQSVRALVADGNGGAFASWSDGRGPGCCDEQTYVTRLVAEGLAAGWPADGRAVTWSGRNANPFLAPDGSGGAIVAWQASRSPGTAGYDVFAARVNAGGNVLGVAGTGAVPPINGPRFLPATPNPGHGGLLVRVIAEEQAISRLEILDASGRHVRTLARELVAAPGVRSFSWDGRDDAGRRVAPGVYLVTVRAGARSTSQRIALLP